MLGIRQLRHRPIWILQATGPLAGRGIEKLSVEEVRSGVNEPLFLIGSVNGDMAIRAQFGRSRRVSRIDLRHICCRRQMALQADRVHPRQCQQFRIAASMRYMAGHASRLLDCLMCVNPRPRQFRVALQTRRNLLRQTRLQLRLKNCVRIMAGRALHRSFVNFVVNRRLKIGLDLGMTAIAERGLRSSQQLPFPARVYRVATDAADTRRPMCRMSKLRVLTGVARQACAIDIFRSSLGRIQDLRRIATTAYMSAAVTMTSLAIELAPRLRRGVRARAKRLHKIGMALRASIRLR